MKCVIMAGGKGSRISSIANEIPKPMIKISGKPVLENSIEVLKKQGIVDIIITVGHLGKIIMDYFGDGSRLGVNISYYYEKELLGNAGALFRIKDELNDDFLLINGDIIFDIDINKMIMYHKKQGGLATILVHPNNHPFDSGIIICDKTNVVRKWLTKEEPKPEFYRNRTNAGMHILSPKLLNNMSKEKVDLDRDILRPLANTGELIAYESTEYVKDMGTPERYFSVCKDYEDGLVKDRNAINKQKAIFLDRDGTINKYVGFLKDIEKFELIEDAADAILLINNSRYLTIVVTNQPVVARGEVTEDELCEIHNKMETLLGKKNAYINDVFFCPHHPDKGFVGEIPELKINCNCRKPKPGLLMKAAEKYNIDLSESWMIGDSETDVLAGKAAGCKTALVNNQEKYGQDLTGKNLYDAVKRILS